MFKSYIGPVMHSSEMRHHADQCRALASEDPAGRDLLLEIAATWERLSDFRELREKESSEGNQAPSSHARKWAGRPKTPARLYRCASRTVSGLKLPHGRFRRQDPALARRLGGVRCVRKTILPSFELNGRKEGFCPFTGLRSSSSEQDPAAPVADGGGVHCRRRLKGNPAAARVEQRG